MWMANEMSSLIFSLLNVLAFVARLSTGFKITYPLPGDTVATWRGVERSGFPVTWTYNSTDDTNVPLYIQYIEVGPRGEASPTATWEDVDITLEKFWIDVEFGLASSYMIRIIHDSDYYVSRGFDVSLTGGGGGGFTTTARSQTSKTSTTEKGTIITSSATSLTTASNPTSSDAENNPSNSGGGLDTGAKVGIGVGVTAAAIIGLVAGFFFARSKKKPAQEVEKTESLPHDGVIEPRVGSKLEEKPQHELDGKDNEKFELPGNEAANELPG